MSVKNQDIAQGIISFLKDAVAKKEIAEEFVDSVDVAIDCVADAFEVDKDDASKVVASKFGGKSFKELLEGSITDSSSSQPAVEVSEEDKQRADTLKLEGNKAMAAKNFEQAVEKYTEALKLNPNNAVYLSNRAAAHTSLSEHQKAVDDAELAIEKDPQFSKAYSRLGLARYALGDAKGSMEAYKKGLDVEGDKKSDAMAKGYETAKKRVEEDLENSIGSKDVAESNAASSTSETDSSSGSRSGASAGASAGAGAGAGGMPDLSNLFGGGGMPNFSELMSNPQVMQAAQQMMSDPSALQGLMNNPAIRQMAQGMGLGGQGGEGEEGSRGPDLSDIMNNPMLRNLANQFGGGGQQQ